MLAALDLFHDDEPLPVTHEAKDRAWRTSQITQMGGRVTFERLSCADSSTQKSSQFVRININDGIVAMPGCESGPGRSCPLGEFLEGIRWRGEELGDFRKVCGLTGADVPDRITFLHQ